MCYTQRAVGRRFPVVEGGYAPKAGVRVLPHPALSAVFCFCARHPPAEKDRTRCWLRSFLYYSTMEEQCQSLGFEGEGGGAWGGREVLAPAVPGLGCFAAAAAGAGFRPAGRGSGTCGAGSGVFRRPGGGGRVSPCGARYFPSRWESTQRIAGGRLRMSASALIFAFPPVPLLRGYSPNPRWRGSGAW